MALVVESDLILNRAITQKMRVLSRSKYWYIDEIREISFQHRDDGIELKCVLRDND
jgi:hypothetical protein